MCRSHLSAAQKGEVICSSNSKLVTDPRLLSVLQVMIPKETFVPKGPELGERDHRY